MTANKEPFTIRSLPSEKIDIPSSMLELLVDDLKSQGSVGETPQIPSNLLSSPNYDVFPPEDFASEPFSPFIGSSLEFQDHSESDFMWVKVNSIYSS